MPSTLDNILNIVIPAAIFTWIGFLFWKAAKGMGMDKGIARLKEYLGGKKKEDTGAMEELPEKRVLEFE